MLYHGKDEDNVQYDNAANTKTETRPNGSYTITVYPAAEFKRRTFKCTEVAYNKSGRVSKMSFEEYK